MRAALPPLRLHSVSLYDKEANVLWLSEGALGPDEHNLVLEAVEALSADTSLNCHENGLEDGRVAIFLPVRAPRGDLVGLAMILADLKSVGDGVLERLVTPQLRTIMQKVAVLLRGASAKGNGSDSAAVPILETGSDASSAKPAVASKPVAAPVQPRASAPAPAPAPVPTAARAPAPAASAKTPTAAAAVSATAGSAPASKANGAGAVPNTLLSAEAVDDILEFVMTPDVPRVETAVEPDASVVVPVLPAALADDDVMLSLEIVEEWKPAVAPTPVIVETPSPAPVAAPAPVAVAPPAPIAAPATPAPAPVATAPVTAASVAPPAAEPTGTSTTLAAPSTTGTSRALNTGGVTGTSRVLSANDPGGLLLEVQPYVKLRPGGRSRRYEVLVRTPHRDAGRDPAALDAHALQRLFSWLSTNRGAWNLEPTSFTLNLSITTLEDERFPQNVASALKTHGIAPDTVGFEIAEPLCMQRRAQVERFIALCDKIGCFVVIDDFSLDSAVLPLLRSKALRLVKIDPKLTSIALKDKLAQALVVAIAQAVKVLGIHCSAKRVEGQAALQWLTAIGCDFAQGPALSQVQPLDALSQISN